MPRARTTHGVAALAGLAGALLLAGCLQLGPRTMAADRFDYSTAIADSWKQQTLLNIVKLCYMDLPVFVDVASIVSGYSLETSVSAGVSLAETDSLGGDIASFGGAGRFTERPTITYVPLTGERFLRSLLTPIDPKNIFYMLQTGYAADFVLALTVESLNGVRNRSALGGTWRESEPEFERAMELLRELQMEGAIGLRVEEGESGSSAVVLLRSRDLPPAIEERASELRGLLGLPAGLERLDLVYSPLRGAEGQLGVNSRSMLQILMAFASFVEVPEQHRREQRVSPALAGASSPDAVTRVRIRCSREAPEEAFVAVPYRGHWFWIDDGDWFTKRALTAVMFLFTLAEGGESERLPLVTIPAQ